MCFCIYIYIRDIKVLDQEEVNLIWLIWIINLIFTKEASQTEKPSQAMIVYSVVILFYYAFSLSSRNSDSRQYHFWLPLDTLVKVTERDGLFLLLCLILLYKRAEQAYFEVWLQ